MFLFPFFFSLFFFLLLFLFSLTLGARIKGKKKKSVPESTGKGPAGWDPGAVPSINPFSGCPRQAPRGPHCLLPTHLTHPKGTKPSRNLPGRPRIPPHTLPPPFPEAQPPAAASREGRKKKNNKNLIQITPNLSEKEAKEAEKRSATGPGRGTHGSLVPPVPAGGVRAPGRAGEGGCPRRGGGWQGRQWA